MGAHFSALILSKILKYSINHNSTNAHLNRGSALELTASQQLVGLLVTVPCFGLLGLITPAWEVNAIGISFPYWALAIGSGILQYALAFLLYLTALKTISVSQAAFFVALIPIFGVASAIVLLGEQPNSLQWIGAACVTVASYSANRLGSENLNGKLIEEVR